MMTDIRIAIVHDPTPGLRADAEVLRAALDAALPGCSIRCWSLPDRSWADHDGPAVTAGHRPFDLLFCLEHLYDAPGFFTPDVTRHVIFVPNMDWLRREDEAVLQSDRVDTVLFKTAHAERLFVAHGLDRLVRRIAGTGWTSPDIACGEKVPRDHDSFLHIRGASPHKNTAALIELWLRRPDFPHLTVVATPRSELEVPVPLIAAPNLTLLQRHLSPAELRRLQMACGVHLCPSITEGFGHTLNEARACAAVLLTVDGPPMNEFAGTGQGVLSAVRSRTAFNRGEASHSGPEELEAAVLQVLALDGPARRRMGRRARHGYEEDRRRFHDAIGKLARTEWMPGGGMRAHPGVR